MQILLEYNVLCDHIYQASGRVLTIGPFHFKRLKTAIDVALRGASGLSPSEEGLSNATPEPPTKIRL